MKRKLSFMLAAVLLALALPQAIYANTIYDIYSCSYDDDNINFKSGKADLKIAEGGKNGKCLFVGGFEKEEDAPEMVLKDLDRKSKATVSLSLKSASGAADARIVVYLKENNEEKSYILAKTKIDDKAWTDINANLMLRFKNVTSAAEIAVVCENENGFCEVYLDDFKVTSDKKTLAEYKPVEEFKETGNYAARISFETGEIKRLKVNDMANYTITDEVPAYTGSKCMRIDSRISSGGTVRVYFDGIDPTATVKVSCWIRNMDGDASRSYLWQGMIPTSQKNYWPDMGAWTKGTDKGWVKVEGTIDLSKYSMTGTPMAQIVATQNNKWFDYYVDEVVVTSDKAGDFFDDMKYSPAEKDPNISDSPAVMRPWNAGVEDDIPILKDVFKDYFKVGACIWDGSQSDTSRYGQLVKKHFNSIVADGCFKPASILLEPDITKYQFQKIDALMDFAFRNGITDVVGHVLTWETPNNVKYMLDSSGNYISREAGLKWLKEYITKVMTHCEGDGQADEYLSGVDYSQWHIDTWDVVNEAVYNEMKYDEKTGKIEFVNVGALINVLGEEYIDYAFKFADETGYDDVKLRYNDYNDQIPDKRQGVYLLVKGLREKGLRVDKIGLQSHFNSDFTAFEHYRNALEMYSSLGVELDITELDVRALSSSELNLRLDPFAEGITKEREYDMADIYAELFNIYREFSDDIEKVNFWTFYDGTAWWNQAKYVKTEYSGIFDRDFKAKPLYWAIVDTEKYYDSIDEDIEVPRIRISGKTLGGEARGDSFNENGIIYSEVIQLLEGLGASAKILDNKINFIKGDVYGEVISGSQEMNLKFENVKLNNTIISRDGKVYVPVQDFAEAMGYYVKVREHRNIVDIMDSGVQYSAY